MDIYSGILLISMLILVAITIYSPAKTYGVPAALVFILAGLFIGNGEILPAYNYPEETAFISQFALSLIIFNGGFQSKISNIRPVLGEGLTLATLGVLITALSLGVFASLVTSLSIVEGLLLGSVVASTDAAVTFSILESKKLKLKYNSDKALEFESATNDPMAFILTLMFSLMLSSEEEMSLTYYILYFFQQLVVGVLVAMAIGFLVQKLFAWIKFNEEDLKPIFILALVMVATLTSDKLGGNQLVTAYLLGVMLGNMKFKFQNTSQKVFNSFAWLSQVLMFLLLGLQITPADTFNFIAMAILPTLFLFLIARPFSVIISYLPFKATINKKVFISWIGIKGATPIVFALVPLTMGVENANVIFNIAVVIVISSMIIHGFTLKASAIKLDLIEE